MADDYPLALRQADAARDNFAAILDELNFLRWQLARLPSRKWLATMGLLGVGSLWALLAAVLLLVR
jgi:hypothetical protein